MTLGELIRALKAVKQDLVCADGFAKPHSYRGDYAELAFEPRRNTSVAEMLDAANAAFGTMYYGWKGGEYTMSEHTAVNIANTGSTGEPLTRAGLSYMLGSWFNEFEAVKIRDEERMAMAAWLQDRADQYSDCCGVTLSDRINEVLSGEHMTAMKSGELDDIVARLERSRPKT